MEEGRQVARAEGVLLPEDYMDEQMDLIDRLAAGGFSSLHHDLVTGHRMELDALHGELLRRSSRAGIDVPATRAVYGILSPWARRNSTPKDRSRGTPRPDG